MTEDKEQLNTLLILGIDFLQKHGLKLDFTARSAAVHHNGSKLSHRETSEQVPQAWETEKSSKRINYAATVSSNQS